MQDLSEAVSRVYKRHGIPTAMRPFQSIRSLLVHPKDKHRPQDICECVYKIPCLKNKLNVRIATRPTLVRQAEHLEYDFRNIGKKSLIVKSGHTHEALADH